MTKSEFMRSFFFFSYPTFKQEKKSIFSIEYLKFEILWEYYFLRYVWQQTGCDVMLPSSVCRPSHSNVAAPFFFCPTGTAPIANIQGDIYQVNSQFLWGRDFCNTDNLLLFFSTWRALRELAYHIQLVEARQRPTSSQVRAEVNQNGRHEVPSRAPGWER